MRWQVAKGGKVVRLQGGRMVRQKGVRYRGLFKGGVYKMSPRFHHFVYDVNKRAKVWDIGSRFSSMVAGMERLSLDLSRAVKNIVRCGSV